MPESLNQSCEPSPELHLNPRVVGLPPSATVAINDRCARLRREGRNIYKLGLGQSPFPVPESVVEALRESAAEKDYLPVLGLEALRSCIAEHHRETFGIDCDPDCVLVGPGSKELMFILQLVYHGEIVIPTPTWVSYAPQARILGRNIRFVPTEAKDGWLLTPDQLDEVCSNEPDRARILVLNYPSNPTGVSYTSDQLKELAEVARRRRVLVLSDEIYAKLHHDGSHRSIVPLYPEGTIFSGGLSKWCGAGGWRLGVFVIPRCLDWLRDAMSAVATETFTSTCAPIQHAAIRAFQGGSDIERYLDKSRQILGALGRLIVSDLRAAGAELVTPQGGFYLFPDFKQHAELLSSRGIKTSPELCERLLEETGVAILPGTHFGRPVNELSARLAYVDFDGAAALEAALALSDEEPIDERFVNKHCSRSIEAVAQLTKWLSKLS